MRVVHVTGKDYFGAGRAAYRLHKGLQLSGVDSLMLVGDKHSDDPSVINIQQGLYKRFRKKLLIKLEKYWLQKAGKQNDHMFSSGIHAFSVASKINSYNADVVHIHWINRGFMKLSDILQIKAPVFITMHDMWYFTGGCHYEKGCEHFQDGCGRCHVLNSENTNDASRVINALKDRIYKRKEIHFIAPSTWMYSEALRSSLLHDQQVVHLSNGILAKQFDLQRINRELLGFNFDKKLVLFAAVDATSDENKGFHLLNQAIDLLDKNRFELIVIGGSKDDQFPEKDITIHSVGYIGDDATLIQYLSVADVVVVPSMQENLSNLIMESLSCSKPVVAFQTGGNGDMIKHQYNGYLASPFNIHDLADGIRWCVDEKRSEELSLNARSTIENNFDIEVVSQKHIDLYTKILNDGSND
nr:glycosyltransferase [uncultured Carboxylicivirga sp.]